MKLLGKPTRVGLGRIAISAGDFNDQLAHNYNDVEEADADAAEEGVVQSDSGGGFLERGEVRVGFSLLGDWLWLGLVCVTGEARPCERAAVRERLWL